VVVFVIGPSGSGKTTVGRTLARQLGWRWVEGDDYHSPASITKMRAGIPLNDSDRAPWLAKLHGVAAAAIDRREHTVIACSALKERYREQLRGGLRGIRFVSLEAGEETLRQRLEQRHHPFAGPALLASQLAAFEPPAGAVRLDASKPPEELVSTIRYELGL